MWNLKKVLSNIFYFDTLRNQQHILEHIYEDTAHRGNILAYAIITIEALLIARLFLIKGHLGNMSPLDLAYLRAYSTLIIVMVISWLLSRFFLSHHQTPYALKRISTLLICEGTIAPLMYISFLDQLTYGQVSVYFCAMVCIAVYPFFEPLWSLLFMFFNQLIFTFGIFYYQPDAYIASAHIVNTVPFIIFMWLISRQFFIGKFKEYHNLETIKNQKNELIQLYQETSLTDDLTGIGNRRYLKSQYETLKSACLSDKTTLTIMFIDGDDLKCINDRLGHRTGDLFIQSISRILAANAEHYGIVVGRIGGDEFLIMAANFNECEASQFAEAICESVKAVSHFNQGIQGSVSIGISRLQPDSLYEFETVISKADAFMYLAKQQGKDQVVSLSTY